MLPINKILTTKSGKKVNSNTKLKTVLKTTEAFINNNKHQMFQYAQFHEVTNELHIFHIIELDHYIPKHLTNLYKHIPNLIPPAKEQPATLSDHIDTRDIAIHFVIKPQVHLLKINNKIHECLDLTLTIVSSDFPHLFLKSNTNYRIFTTFDVEDICEMIKKFTEFLCYTPQITTLLPHELSTKNFSYISNNKNSIFDRITEEKLLVIKKINQLNQDYAIYNHFAESNYQHIDASIKTDIESIATNTQLLHKQLTELKLNNLELLSVNVVQNFITQIKELFEEIKLNQYFSPKCSALINKINTLNLSINSLINNVNIEIKQISKKQAKLNKNIVNLNNFISINQDINTNLSKIIALILVYANNHIFKINNQFGQLNQEINTINKWINNINNNIEKQINKIQKATIIQTNSANMTNSSNSSNTTNTTNVLNINANNSSNNLIHIEYLTLANHINNFITLINKPTNKINTQTTYINNSNKEANHINQAKFEFNTILYKMYEFATKNFIEDINPNTKILINFKFFYTITLVKHYITKDKIPLAYEILIQLEQIHLSKKQHQKYNYYKLCLIWELKKINMLTPKQSIILIPESYVKNLVIKILNNYCNEFFLDNNTELNYEKITPMQFTLCLLIASIAKLYKFTLELKNFSKIVKNIFNNTLSSKLNLLNNDKIAKKEFNTLLEAVTIIAKEKIQHTQYFQTYFIIPYKEILFHKELNQVLSLQEQLSCKSKLKTQEFSLILRMHFLNNSSYLKKGYELHSLIKNINPPQFIIDTMYYPSKRKMEIYSKENITNLSGKAYFEINDHKKAVESLIDAYNTANRKNNKFAQAKIFISWGKCYMKTNHYEKALKTFSAAETLAKNLPRNSTSVLRTEAMFSLILANMKLLTFIPSNCSEEKKSINVIKTLIKQTINEMMYTNKLISNGIPIEINEIRKKNIYYNLGKFLEEISFKYSNIFEEKFKNITFKQIIWYCYNAYLITKNIAIQHKKPSILFDVIESNQAILEHNNYLSILSNMLDIYDLKMTTKTLLSDIGFSDTLIFHPLNDLYNSLFEKFNKETYSKSNDKSKLLYKTIQKFTFDIDFLQQFNNQVLKIFYKAEKHYKYFLKLGQDIKSSAYKIELNSALFSLSDEHKLLFKTKTNKKFYEKKFDFLRQNIQTNLLHLVENMNLSTLNYFKDLPQGFVFIYHRFNFGQNLVSLILIDTRKNHSNYKQILKWDKKNKPVFITVPLPSYYVNHYCDLKEVKSHLRFNYSDPNITINNGEIIPDKIKLNNTLNLEYFYNLLFKPIINKLFSMNIKNLLICVQRETQYIPYYVLCEKSIDSLKYMIDSKINLALYSPPILPHNKFFYKGKEKVNFIMLSNSNHSKEIKSSLIEKELSKKNIEREKTSLLNMFKNTKPKYKIFKDEKLLLEKTHNKESFHEQNNCTEQNSNTGILNTLRTIKSKIIYINLDYLSQIKGISPLDYNGGYKLLNDKYLTAKNIDGIDLSKTELVILNGNHTVIGNAYSHGSMSLWKKFIDQGVKSIIVTFLPSFKQISIIFIEKLSEAFQKDLTLVESVKYAMNEIRKKGNNKNFPYVFGNYIVITSNPESGCKLSFQKVLDRSHEKINDTTTTKKRNLHKK